MKNQENGDLTAHEILLKNKMILFNENITSDYLWREICGWRKCSVHTMKA